MMAVSVTSLGFGDQVPISTLGRAIVAMVSLIGVVLMGVFISQAYQFLSVSESEKKKIENFRSMKQHRELRTAAASVIQLGWRLFIIKNHMRHMRGGKGDEFYGSSRSSDYFVGTDFCKKKIFGRKKKKKLPNTVVASFLAMVLQSKLSTAIENMVRLRKSCRKNDEAPTIGMLYLKVQELSDQINSIVRKKRDLRRLKSEPYEMIDDFSI